MENKMMSLQMSEDMLKPIIEKHIKAGIIESLGGADKLINAMVHNMCTQKVDDKLNPSSYSYSKPLIEVLYTNLLKDSIKEIMQEEVNKNKGVFKKAIIKAMKEETTANKIANSLINAFSDTLCSWRSTVEIKIDGNN